ncbi:MAG TPA: ABC transporter substrate-binding protein [Chloroflexota bacterium]|jgi:ABC-type nitrate/sulfonate/bicarbonate transport system substrate-binding protein
MARRTNFMLLGVCILLGACAASTAGSAPAKPAAPEKPAAVAPSPAASGAAPAAQQAAPAAPAAPIGVRLASGVISLGTAPLTVARKKGYFAEEGVDLDWQLVQGGAAVAAALTGGDIQFADGSAADLIGLVGRNLRMVAVVDQASKVTQDIVVSARWAAAKGVTPQSPLRDRIAALKGAKMGITSPGGAPDRYGRWLEGQVGLTEDDVEHPRVGGGPEIKVALRQGQIDGFLFSPPLGPELEAEGVAVTLIPGGDVPEWADFPHAILYIVKEYGQRNAEAVTRVGRAIARGAQLIRSDPQEARRTLQEEFKDTDPQILQVSVDRLKDAYPPDGKFTQRQWDNAMKLLVESGTAARAVDTQEGGIWTNEYLR